jgi:hypothetical protein
MDGGVPNFSGFFIASFWSRSSIKVSISLAFQITHNVPAVYDIFAVAGWRGVSAKGKNWG